MANGQTFIADMQRWGLESGEKLNAVARQAVQEVAIRVQDNTGPPIGPNIITSFLINSWQPAIGAPPPPPKNGGKPPPGYQGSQKDVDAELSLLVATMSVGDVFFYVNNASYAMRQNYGFIGQDSLGRSYHQVGRYFVEKTLSQWQNIVDQIVADLNFKP